MNACLHENYKAELLSKCFWFYFITLTELIESTATTGKHAKKDIQKENA